MLSGSALLIFLGTALLVAVMPGPGLLYIAGRTLGGGRREGFASCYGTAIGGLIHVIAGALGVSALIMASAQSFLVLKLIGGAYLIYLGIQTWRSAGTFALRAEAEQEGPWTAFRQGIVVEATNPKTAAFFLALLPQFIDTTKDVMDQFLFLGSISIILNTANAMAIVVVVSILRERAFGRPNFVARLRQASGTLLGGLGVWLLFARKPA